MGSDPSKETGHGVSFWELFEEDWLNGRHIPLYCHTPGTTNWTTKLPVDTAAVSVDDNMGMSGMATLGFQEDDMVEYMNYVRLGPKAPLEVIMHELGHTMGMYIDEYGSCKDTDI